MKVDRTQIPERYAITWFEEATKQDEPEIQQLFARLLARAAAGDEDAADRRQLEILHDLRLWTQRLLLGFSRRRSPGNTLHGPNMICGEE